MAGWRPRERKLATVIFADLVGSTALGDRQDPERTRALLDRFYAAMAEEIEAAGGTVEKFLGDAIMASFGAPAALEDHAERALTPRSPCARLARRLRRTAALRIGVDTGEVVVGRPREAARSARRAVNVAARLEQAAEPGEILVGERTVEPVRGAFEFGRRMTVEAKGKAGLSWPAAAARALADAPAGCAHSAPSSAARPSSSRCARRTRARSRGGRPHLVTDHRRRRRRQDALVRELWAGLASRRRSRLRRTGRCLAARPRHDLLAAGRGPERARRPARDRPAGARPRRGSASARSSG